MKADIICARFEVSRMITVKSIFLQEVMLADSHYGLSGESAYAVYLNSKLTVLNPIGYIVAP